MKDLFEHPELIPANVKAVLDTFDGDKDPYKECQRIEDDLKPLGYTFEWGLDGEPYNLRSTASKVKKAVKQARNECKRLMIEPYKHGINYAQTVDNLRFFADALHHIELNRSFIKLGLNK